MHDCTVMCLMRKVIINTVPAFICWNHPIVVRGYTVTHKVP